MRAEALAISGAWVLHEACHRDDRGSFTRVADLRDLPAMGVTMSPGQLSYATNPAIGTIRGLHFQVEPYGETKLIWCVSGRAFDVLVDVRPDSATFGRHVAVEISADEPTAVLVMPGIAHGYQTLAPDTTLVYLIDADFDPARARSLRWDDPTVGVRWPLPPGPMSQRDAEAPNWPPAS